MAYTPPSGHAVNLDFGATAYTPPLGHAVNLDLSPDQTISGLGAYDAALFGSTTATPTNTVLPAGLDVAAIPAPVVKPDQFIRPTGAAYTQYGTLLLIPDQFVRNVGGFDAALIQAPTRVYNLTQTLSGITAGDLGGHFGADSLRTDPVLYPSSTVFTQYGTARLSTSPQYLVPGSWQADLYGSATVKNQNQVIQYAGAISGLNFGLNIPAPQLVRDPQLITDLGHDFLQLGEPASTHVTTDPQYIRPTGYVATIYGTGINGTTRISLWNQYVNPSGLAVGNFGTFWISLYTRYVQPIAVDPLVVWDDYGPMSIAAGELGGAQIFVRDALVLPTVGALTQYGTATVSN